MYRMTPEEAVKHVWLAGHYNHINTINNISANGTKVENHNYNNNVNNRRQSTAKSIQSLTVREMETGLHIFSQTLHTIPLV